MMPLQFLRGFLMGSADVVPGVSGGTVALVVGIYPRLVANIRDGSKALGSFSRLQFSAGWERLKEIEWRFLVPLLAGIAVALVSLAGLVKTLLEDHPVEMAALFFGLVAASVLVARRMVAQWDWLRLGIMIGVAIIAFIVLGYRSGEADTPATWIFFFAGAFAISAMILPGVSGSFLLVMLGMYEAVLGAVNDREIVMLLVFVIGAVVGLAVFSSVLHWALRTHPNTVMAAITGLLLGSLRVLWPWPNGIEGPEMSGPIADEFAAPVLLAIVGAGIVFLLTQLGERSGAAVDA